MKHDQEKYRIATIIWKDGIGGAERSLTDLAAALDRDKFDMRFYYLAGTAGHFATQIQSLGFKTEFLGWKNGFDLRGKYKLIKRLKEYAPHLVHEHILPAPTLVIIKMFLSCPTVSTEHGAASIVLATPSKFKITTILKRFDFLFSDIIAANSHTSFEALKTVFKIPASKIQIVYLGINLDNFNKAKIKHEKFRIGYIGRIDNRHKGVDYLPKLALQLQQSSLKKFEFFIAGDGPDRHETEEICTRLGVAQYFHFLGWIHDVQDFLASIDVLVIPSRFEPFGLTAIEALAMDLPVVAFDVGGLHEILEKCTDGYLVPQGNTTKMAEVIINLQDNKQIKNGRLYVMNNFSNQTMSNKLKEIYLHLIQGHSTH